MKNKISDSYYVKINDAFILNSVLEYANENKIDSSKSLIGINIKTDTYRTSVYISHSIRDLSKYTRLPSYYTTIKNFVVLIYTDAGKFIETSSIKPELDALITRENISLDTVEMIEENPGWKFTKCEDRITKERETEEIELPCFLKLAAVDGKLEIVEQDWFKESKSKGK
jgi:hypothetical protein